MAAPGAAVYVPSPEGLVCLERARALLPAVARCAGDADRGRLLPAPLVEALHEAGLFRMLLPRACGGAELDPVSFVHVLETVAGTDASTAWVLCQTAGCSMVAAFVPPDVAAAIFTDDPRGVLAWGPPASDARAVAVPGGYRVSGTWSFASGGHHATWLGGACTVYDGDGTPRRTREGRAVGRTMLFPASAATVADTWDVIGLRGTRSDSYTVRDVFVPSAYSVARDDQAERRDGSPLYCFPAGSLFASGFAAVALGVARAMLDALVAVARDKTPRGATRTVRESEVVQSQVARGEARLGSARAFLLTTLGDVWRRVAATNTLALDERMRIRLAGTHAIHEAVAVAVAVYHAAGSSAIFASGPFERRFRDVHTVAQQVQGRDSHFETVGRFLLGLDADTTFL